MIKLIQAAMFFTGIVLGGLSIMPHHEDKPVPGQFKAGIHYLQNYDRSFAQRQLDCAADPKCVDPALLNASASRP